MHAILVLALCRYSYLLRELSAEHKSFWLALSCTITVGGTIYTKSAAMTLLLLVNEELTRDRALSFYKLVCIPTM